MPSAAVKTIRDLIYWQYAKIMAKSARMEKNCGFITDTVYATNKVSQAESHASKSGAGTTSGNLLSIGKELSYVFRLISPGLA